MLLLITVASTLVIVILIYAILNQYIVKPFSYLILLGMPLIINIVSISNICLEKYRNKDKLNEEQ